jgi:dephospho-CoA kinase
MKDKTAIFVCGSGGSGKSTFCNEYLKNYTIVDVDIIYEKLLIENKLGLRIKDFDKKTLTKSYRLFEEAKVLNDIKLKKAIDNKENIVIDGIGRDTSIILYQRNILEKNGYDTFMIMMYAELEECINRVENRNRVYSKNITIDSWYLSYGNISEFKKEFNDRFVLIYNEDINRKEKIDIFINEYNNKKDII